MSDESSRPPKKRHDRHPLVLIIEEEESIRALLHRVLEAEGCAVMTASDAAEAISLLEDHPGAIDLVIADIAEPGVRGPGGLMRWLASTTKLLLLSMGTTAPTASGEAEEIPLLHRPFQVNALRDKVRELLRDLRGPQREESRNE
jgi:DNA-binding response OmpR family regulator